MKRHARALSTLPDVPAFPLDGGVSADDPYTGLTKREYFAAQVYPVLVRDLSLSVERSAENAVMYANALIDALNTDELRRAMPVDTSDQDTEPLE